MSTLTSSSNSSNNNNKTNSTGVTGKKGNLLVERLHVLTEIITTEETYVNNLFLCKSLYEDPLFRRTFESLNIEENGNDQKKNRERRFSRNNRNSSNGVNSGRNSGRRTPKRFSLKNSKQEEINMLEEQQEQQQNAYLSLHEDEQPYADVYLRFVNTPLMHRREHTKIFNDLLAIRALNSKLLEELKLHYEQACTTGKKPDMNLGDIFLKFAPWFRTYTAYTSQFNNVATLLREMRKENTEFDKFLNRVKNKHPKAQALSLESYLIQPVQRIPRYTLLLNELLKLTPELHKDRESLTKALSEMKAVADYVNNKIKEFEHILKMNEIDAIINNTLLKSKNDASAMSLLSKNLNVISPLLIPSRSLKHQVKRCKITINGTPGYLPNDHSYFSLYIFNDVILYFRTLVACEENGNNGEDLTARKALKKRFSTSQDKNISEKINKETKQYCGCIHLEAEKVPWCYINICDKSVPGNEFKIVTEEDLFSIELPTEEEMANSLKVLVEVLEEICKERKQKFINAEVPRPNIRFVPPPITDPLSSSSSQSAPKSSTSNSTNNSDTGGNNNLSPPSPIKAVRSSLALQISNRKSQGEEQNIGYFLSSSNTTAKKGTVVPMLKLNGIRPKSMQSSPDQLRIVGDLLNPYLISRSDFPSRALGSEIQSDFTPRRRKSLMQRLFSLAPSPRHHEEQQKAFVTTPVVQLKMTEEEIRDLSKRDRFSAISMCYATYTFYPQIETNNTGISNDEIQFRRGDIFLVFEKVIAKDTIWLKVRKVGLNCDSMCHLLLKEERKSKDYASMIQEMKNQKPKKKINFTTEKPHERIIRRLAGIHLIIVDDHFWGEAMQEDKALSESIDLSDLFKHQQSDPSSTSPRSPLDEKASRKSDEKSRSNADKPSESTSKSNSLDAQVEESLELYSNFALNSSVPVITPTLPTPRTARKSISSLLGSKKSRSTVDLMPLITELAENTDIAFTPLQEQQFINRIINIYKDNNLVGLIPIDFVREIPPSTQQKVQQLIELRDIEESKKIRNYVVRRTSQMKIP